MKLKSPKNKGSRLERKVAQIIREKGLDKDAKRMVLSGADWAFRTDIHTKLPYAIECKNTERHNIWSEWEQARDQSKPFKPPVLVISGNYRPILAVMDIHDWMDLVAKVEFYEGGTNGK